MDSPNYHTLAVLQGPEYLLFRKRRVRKEKFTEFEGRALAAVPSIAHNAKARQLLGQQF